MDSKFYVGFTNADGVSAFVVELSDDEYNAVLKFVSAQYDFVYDEGHSGNFCVSDKCFTTKEQAIDFINKRMI